MKPAFTLAVAAIASLALSSCSTLNEVKAPIDAPQKAEITPDSLLGTWDVALLFDANAPPSSTVMEITSVNEDGTLAGSFYYSAFETARYRLMEDGIAITVITSDNSGPYMTSGRLNQSDPFEGQTLSTGRDFLMTWTAKKAD